MLRPITDYEEWDDSEDESENFDQPLYYDDDDGDF